MEWIATLIRQALSPEQIVDYLTRHKHFSLRHETVYRLIDEDKAACLLQTDRWCSVHALTGGIQALPQALWTLRSSWQAQESR